MFVVLYTTYLTIVRNLFPYIFFARRKKVKVRLLYLLLWDIITHFVATILIPLTTTYVLTRIAFIVLQCVTIISLTLL